MRKIKLRGNTWKALLAFLTPWLSTLLRSPVIVERAVAQYIILLQPDTAAFTVAGSPTSPTTMSTDLGSISITSGSFLLTKACHDRRNLGSVFPLFIGKNTDKKSLNKVKHYNSTSCRRNSSDVGGEKIFQILFKPKSREVVGFCNINVHRSFCTVDCFKGVHITQWNTQTLEFQLVMMEGTS